MINHSPINLASGESQMADGMVKGVLTGVRSYGNRRPRLAPLLKDPLEGTNQGVPRELPEFLLGQHLMT